MTTAPSRLLRGTPPRILALQALIVLAVLLPLAGAGLWLWNKHQWATDRLAQLEPRYARMAGLIEGKDKLQQAEAATRTLLAQHAYPASQDAVQAGNDAQQRIRALFADSKLDVGSIQVLPAKELQQFDRIGISLRIEGDIVGLQNALALLETQRPTVWVDTVAIQTIGPVKPQSPVRLGAQLTFSVLRSRS